MSVSLGTYIFLKTGGLVGAVLFSIGLLAVIHYRFMCWTNCVRNFKRPADLIVLFIMLVFNVLGCWLSSLAVTDPATVAQCEGIVASRTEAGFLNALLNGTGCGFILSLCLMCKNRIALVIGVPAFILAGFTHSVMDAFIYAVGSAELSGAAILPYLGTVLGNLVGGVLYKAGSEVR